MRTRFAPSPTGSLHVGGARTAVLNWLLARRHGGAFVLRIEDTDLERNVPGAEQTILDDLRWLGLDWDEGPDRGGPFGPYRQSERFELYRERAEELLRDGRAYVCTCPPSQAEEGDARERRCPCADAAPTAGGIPAGAAVRFRVPDGAEEVAVADIVRGMVTFPADSIEDFVLLRSDGRPTYNFAAAVDDAAMQITDVVRGADHLINTPKQLLLYHAFGWEPPRFAHIPLILGADRQKLSKRHGATSVSEHRRIGYVPEALVNYLSLLSWSSPTGEEVLPRDRLIAEVDLERVGAADAVFDRDKLRWLSSKYIQDLPLGEFTERVAEYVDAERFPFPAEVFPVAISAVQNRLSVLSEIGEELAPFLGPQTQAQRAAREAVLADPAARQVLGGVRARLEGLPEWEEEAINAAIREGGRDVSARGKALFQPVRLALTGEEHGLELPKIVRVLGRERTMELLAA